MGSSIFVITVINSNKIDQSIVMYAERVFIILTIIVITSVIALEGRICVSFLVYC